MVAENIGHRLLVLETRFAAALRERFAVSARGGRVADDQGLVAAGFRVAVADQDDRRERRVGLVARLEDRILEAELVDEVRAENVIVRKVDRVRIVGARLQRVVEARD
jgi:hypothetical protein